MINKPTFPYGIAVSRQAIPNSATGSLGALAAALALLLGAMPASADNPGHPGIVPPNEKVEGKTYGDWAGAWWQWALGVPADRNPLTDTTGEFCDEDQHGPVWFLAGTFGTSAERTCHVPSGKHIFVPVYNWIFGSGVFDCDPTVPGVPCDVDALRQMAAAQTEKAEILDVRIDGVTVQNVRDYRARSPQPFSLKYPDNSVTGVPKGKYYPQVADGYWLMLEPLANGQHEIRLHVRAPDTSAGLIEFVLITHLTVAEPKKPRVIPINAKFHGKTYGEWSAEHWKWTFSFPVDHHPQTDTADCDAGQSGPVWFLGGTFSTTVDPSGTVVGVADRHCTVPAGKGLFFPVINSECSTIEGNGQTDAELRACAQFFADGAQDLFCSIDGEPVKDLATYRAQSPLFTFGPLPANNVLQSFGLDAPAGSTSPSVADGFYIMLAPLSEGGHTLHFGGKLVFTKAEDGFDFVFRLDITYHLIVLAKDASPFVVTSLGSPAPAGGTFVNDFEPGGLNSNGDIAFGADVSTGGEGVFLRRDEEIIELGRTGAAAPGGGTFEFGFLGPVALNERGDMVFDFLLKDFTPPFGVNAGAYLYSHQTGQVTPVVIPHVTPAPDGGTFRGVSFQPTINNRGDVVFCGIIATEHGVHNVPNNGEPYLGLGVGIFRCDARGAITSLVSPGDEAPGGGTFDYAYEPWVNDDGAVSFIGHIAGQESVVAGFPAQADFISALGGLYLKKAGHGKIRAIVRAGDPAPGGGHFRQIFHDVMNNRGDIVFNGDLTSAPGANQSIGVFLYSYGKITAIARPGDPMPGGGNLVNASLVGGNVHINNPGDVVFSGVVHTDVDGDGFDDTGLFQWSHGRLSVIARTGTVIAGVGTVDELASPQMVIPPAPVPTTTSGAINNDRGQVVFQATLADGRGVLLLAAPVP